jgi:hypothetical protein
MIKLKLKIRDRSNSIVLSMPLLREWLRQPEEVAKQRMYTFFEPLKDDEPTVHDHTFIAQIVDWTPVDERSGRQLGLPLTEQVRWINLAQKLEPFMDSEEEGDLELSNKDIEALWTRMNDKEFKVMALTPPYIAFLMDFQKATNRWFDDLEMEDSELEEVKGSDNERERDKVSAAN